MRKIDSLHPESLDQLGLRHGIDQSSAGHDYLRIYQRELSSIGLPLRNIVIISGINSVKTARVFGEYFPEAQIHVLATRAALEEHKHDLPPNARVVFCRTRKERHEVLRKIPPPEVVIEDGTNLRSDKRETFREFFFYLPTGGIYIAEDLHASYMPKLNDDDKEDVSQLILRLTMLKAKGIEGTSSDDRELSNAIDSVTHYGKIILVKKTGVHLVKLRDSETNNLLSTNSDGLLGTVLDFSPSQIVDSRAKFFSNRKDLEEKLIVNPVSVPALSVREYSNVECLPGQISRQGRYLLASSFRHPAEWRLNNRNLIDVSHHFARIAEKSRKSRYLNGAYYYLDTEYPGHFGHITSEVISLLYGWELAKVRYPEVKALVSLQPSSSDLPEFQWEIFAAYGIDKSQVVLIADDESVTVETLVASTPMFANPLWAAPEIAETWRLLGNRLRLSSGHRWEKIFVSRRNERIRRCRNVEKLEELFVEFGYTIIYPEDFPFRQQVDIFMSAKSIGGFGGSGMFNMMFSEIPGNRYVISSESYTATNEYLISSVKGDNVHYFWENADVKHPKGGWSWKAFFSDFEFDFNESGGRLRRLLEAE